MEEIIDIPALIDALVQRKAPLEELVKRSLHNLYAIESRFLAPSAIQFRNNIRATIAFVKVLYDCAQQMALARLYLLHKIQVLEVRESDFNASISVLCAESPKEDTVNETNMASPKTDVLASEDDELSILMDARMIKDIDQSRSFLQSMSQLISEKSQELQDIEESMDCMSNLLPPIDSARDKSIPEIEPHSISGSCGVGCTHLYGAISHSRVGDTQEMSPNYNNMAMSMEQDINVLPQGELGTPRGRHGSEPDAAGSIAIARESCEGTVGVDSVSAPTAQAVTTEQIAFPDETIPVQEDPLENIPPGSTGEKRKASESPRSDACVTEDSELDVPAPRRSLRSKRQADFGKLTAARQKRSGKLVCDPLIDSDTDSAEKVNSIIESIVKRIQEENIASSRVHSGSSSACSVGSDPQYCMISTGSSVEENNISKKSKKNIGKKKQDKDSSVKNPIAKKKDTRSMIVSKEEAEREMTYRREDWLKMDGAELGARCLDHLEELERQRGLSKNISGIVAGRMKESKYIAAEITKALIEKITTVGDVYSLRTENYSLREELAEFKRKEQAQNREIAALRRMISNLEREVRSLKDGFGPYTAAPPPRLASAKRQRAPESEPVKAREKKAALQRSPRIEGVATSSDLVASTPGCSTDDVYMQRHDWPTGKETSPWPVQMEVDQVTPDTKVNSVNTIKTNFNDRLKSRSKGVRIIDNRQIVPPSFPPSSAEWRRVERNKTVKNKTITTPHKIVEASAPVVSATRRDTTGKGKPVRRLVRPAVVTITNKTGGASYAEILTKAREKVSLKDLGISETVVRRAMNGAIVIEVPGPAGKQLAGALSSHLAAALGDEARVSNPVATGELRIRGVDPSTTSEDILDELEAVGGCPRREFKVSPIVNMRDGMGITWVVCPLEAAVRVAEQGVLRLGWTRVRVELLKKKPVQCYNCWHFGHVRLNCRSSINRVGSCFRCGMPGHTARSCETVRPKCAICAEVGKESGHRMGSPCCLVNHGFPSGVQLVKKKASVVRARGG